MPDEPSAIARAALHVMLDWYSPAEEQRRAIPAYVMAAALYLEPDAATFRATLAELIDHELIEDVTPKEMKWHRGGGAIVDVERWPAGKYRLSDGREIELSRTVPPSTCADQKPSSRNVILGINYGGESPLPADWTAPVASWTDVLKARETREALAALPNWQIAGVIVGSIIPDTCRLYKLRKAGRDAISAQEAPDAPEWSSKWHRLNIGDDSTLTFDGPDNGPEQKKRWPFSENYRRLENSKRFTKGQAIALRLLDAGRLKNEPVKLTDINKEIGRTIDSSLRDLFRSRLEFWDNYIIENEDEVFLLDPPD